MTEKATPVSGDRSVYPSEEILRSITGDMMNIWQKIVDHAESDLSEVIKEQFR